MSAELRAAGLSEHAAANAAAKEHVLGLPAGTILRLIQQYGPVALQILEQLLGGGAGSTPAPTA